MSSYSFENVCAWTNGFIFVLVHFWREEGGPNHIEDGNRLNTICSQYYMNTGAKLGDQVDPMAIVLKLQPMLPNALRIEVRHGNQAVAMQGR